MSRALAIAARGEGLVEPNPMVGCVLVRDGQIVGEGRHERFGGPHAEVLALQDAGENAAGATAYVTLEPCCHHGKTPPCAEALLRAGVTRVVAAVEDPFPQVAGGGIDKLRAAGIECDVGVQADKARWL
ncbi:MAG: bifunctional diaminohydroxyphosphoribosylaminopyrimidine deaminase/5-amino-6-(5-phosphoribosylamino)uracil reductase RibD, partial [Planctomycetes bacterium]|nr:bifunctional diaminohydroxyphosphoribosylaminopyrimidine deaminase/5-amino-6-(5-phosphoribosylamino)uracil reductase RibD [Planctomycetota bacterium]